MVSLDYSHRPVKFHGMLICSIILFLHLLKLHWLNYAHVTNMCTSAVAFFAALCGRECLSLPLSVEVYNVQ